MLGSLEDCPIRRPPRPRKHRTWSPRLGVIAVRFGSVDFQKVIQTKPNQTNAVRIGS
ncbi:hypothetical protein A2U01_0085245, partial [Trifolium medium]|nr:hypothetical protein [Trifolium medium]